jgi:hypothetical protein
VELGLALPNIRTALNVEKGMALLQKAFAQQEAIDGHSES